MIKISDLKEGELVIVDFEGTLMEGEVFEINNSQKLAKIPTNGQNEFWYAGEVLKAIPLGDAVLKKLNFIREDQSDGSVKYLKGAFRVQLERQDDFSNVSYWYREDKRRVNQQIALHKLQNYYLNMTKVHLTASAI